jgi:hypothetical protein
MFRFTIRDLLWLMVVVGLALGWGLNWKAWNRERAGLQKEQILLEENHVADEHIWRSENSRLEEITAKQNGTTWSVRRVK